MPNSVLNFLVDKPLAILGIVVGAVILGKVARRIVKTKPDRGPAANTLERVRARGHRAWLSRPPSAAEPSAIRPLSTARTGWTSGPGQLGNLWLPRSRSGHP